MNILKKKKIIIANSILLLVLVIGTVFAWFAVNYNNKVNSKEVTVISDGALELSLDGETWQSSINLSNDTAWFKKTKFTDITGSGDGTFLRPTLKQGGNKATVNTDSDWSKNEISYAESKDSISEDGFDYAKFTVYMRSTEELTISLGENNDKPSGVYSIDALSGSEVKNLAGIDSTGTRYSKDLIVGAIRISAIKLSTDADNNTIRDHLFTWIPRPEIDVGSYETFSTTSVSINKENGASFTHNYLPSTSKYTDVAVTLDGNKVITGNLSEDKKQQLLKLTKVNDTDRYYTGAIEFNIWLEGCDNEARRAFVQGQFQVLLNIISEQISA